MRSRRIVTVIAVATASAALLASCSSGEAGTTPTSSGSAGATPLTLNLATAGDTNMIDLQDNLAVPGFVELNPGAQINVTGTGAGDPGSVAIAERLAAQKDAGSTSWDTDIAIVNQSVMGELIEQGLVEQWVPDSANADLIIADNASNALGVDVAGYVAPLYQSQIAIAYNSETVPDGFETMADIESFITENPQRFGYNGVTNGASGVGFVAAWLAWKSGQGEQIFNGPYDEAAEEGWNDILADLKELPATITNGNNGTLDQLNRGEIDAGPVWVDMYSQWQNEGRLGPEISVQIPEEGLPSQPMYIVIPTNGANKEAAIQYAEYLTSPEFQAEVIVDQMGWYPGVDPEQVLPLLSEEASEKFFSSITPDVLAESALPFPIVEFNTDIQQLYSSAN